MIHFVELVKNGDIFLMPYRVPSAFHKEEDKYKNQIIRNEKVFRFLIQNPNIIFDHLKTDVNMEQDSWKIIFNTFYFEGLCTTFLTIPSGYHYNFLLVDRKKREVVANPWIMECGFDSHGEVLVKKSPDLVIF